jgi:hypothetical protein
MLNSNNRIWIAAVFQLWNEEPVPILEARFVAGRIFVLLSALEIEVEWFLPIAYTIYECLHDVTGGGFFSR